MTSRSRKCSYGVRTSGPLVKSGPRKGQYRCYKSESSARGAATRMSRYGSPSLSSNVWGESETTWSGASPCRYGIRTSGPLVKSGSRKGQYRCYKSESSARGARTRMSRYGSPSGSASLSGNVTTGSSLFNSPSPFHRERSPYRYVSSKTFGSTKKAKPNKMLMIEGIPGQPVNFDFGDDLHSPSPFVGPTPVMAMH